MISAEGLSFLRRLLDADCVSAMAHITGGGITENLPRVLPKGTAAIVEMGKWPVLPIFTHLQKLGSIEQSEMMRTFNMGIGMVACVAAGDADRTLSLLKALGEESWRIGRVARGVNGVVIH